MRLRQLYWQRAVAADAPRGPTVAFNLVAAIPTEETTCAYVGPWTRYHGLCGGAPTIAWDGLAAVLPSGSAPTSTGSAGPTLFVGRLRSASGNRLVHVTLDSELDGYTDTLHLSTLVVVPGSLVRPPVANGLEQDLDCPDQQRRRDMLADPSVSQAERDGITVRQVNRGVVDPTDPARFTCDYVTYGGRRHRIVGTLSADGRSVTYTYVDGPNTVATTGPIATPAAGR